MNPQSPHTTQAATPLVSIASGKATVLSTDVARHFGKRHGNVLRDIEGLIAQLPAEHQLNFEEMFYESEVGQGATRKFRAYRLTRDGFTLLAMGFTGKKALQFKLAYIDAFNRMEAMLNVGSIRSPRMRSYTEIRAVPRLDRYQWRLINRKAAALGAAFENECRDYLLWRLAGCRPGAVPDGEVHAQMYYASTEDVAAFAHVRATYRHLQSFSIGRELFG